VTVPLPSRRSPRRIRSSAALTAEFVQVLANTPNLVDALLVTHDPLVDQCRPYSTDPCSTYLIAEAAEREVRRRSRGPRRYAAA
jgi:hypothetical protein